MPMDSLYPPDSDFLMPSPVSPRADLAARRASLVRMNAVTKDKTKKKKKQNIETELEMEGIELNPEGRRKKRRSLTGKKTSLKRGSMKKRVPASPIPGIPMPFFQAQANYSKAFKLFPDLAVSQYPY